MEKFLEGSMAIALGIAGRLVALVSKSEKKKISQKLVLVNIFVGGNISAAVLLLAWGYGGINVYLMGFTCWAAAYGGMELIDFVWPVIKNGLVAILENFIKSLGGSVKKERERDEK